MFRRLQARVLMLNLLRASGQKAISAKVKRRTTRTTLKNKQCKKVILPQDLNLQSLDYRSMLYQLSYKGCLLACLILAIQTQFCDDDNNLICFLRIRIACF